MAARGQCIKGVKITTPHNTHWINFISLSLSISVKFLLLLVSMFVSFTEYVAVSARRKGLYYSSANLKRCPPFGLKNFFFFFRLWYMLNSLSDCDLFHNWKRFSLGQKKKVGMGGMVEHSTYLSGRPQDAPLEGVRGWRRYWYTVIFMLRAPILLSSYLAHLTF